MKYYKAFLRSNPYLIEDYGCWCENTELCHGGALVKQYIEKIGEKERERKKIEDLLKRVKKHYVWINMKILL